MAGVDVFGRYLLGRNQSVRGVPGYGYKRTNDGDYDIDNKRLCNIADPIRNTDATSMNSVLKIVENYDLKVQEGLKRVHNSLAAVVQNHETKISQNINGFDSVKKLVDSMTVRLNKNERHIDEMEVMIVDINLKITSIISELKKILNK